MRASIIVVTFIISMLFLGFGIGNTYQYQNDEEILYHIPQDEYSPSYETHMDIPNLDSVFDSTIPVAVGSYTKGGLRNAIRIRDEGIGYVKILRGNNSSYGTHYLVSTVEYVTSEMRDRYPNHPRLQITALSKNGGGHSPGHDSHQNGLDMDALYLQKQGVDRRINRIIDSDKPNGEEEFVKNDIVSNKLDLQRNFQLMHLFVKTGRVNTIFADRSIKKALCIYARSSGITGFENTLAKIKHWPNHKTHFHIRLKCPNSSRQCRETTSANEGPGCELQRPPPIPRKPIMRING